MNDDARRSQDVLWIKPLPRYRINFLNPDGTIFRTEVLEVSADEDAIQAAKRRMDGRALDLWDGLRFIEFFPRINPPG